MRKLTALTGIFDAEKSDHHCRVKAILRALGFSVLLGLLFAPHLAHSQSCTAEGRVKADLQGNRGSLSVIDTKTICVGASRLRLSRLEAFGGARIDSSSISDSHYSGEAGIRLGHNNDNGPANTLERRIESEIIFVEPLSTSTQKPVKDLKFRIHDLDAGDNIIINAYKQDGGLISIVGSMYPEIGSNVTFMGENQFQGGSDDIPSNDPTRRSGILLDFTGYSISRVVFQYWDTLGPGTYTAAEFEAYANFSPTISSVPSSQNVVEEMASTILKDIRFADTENDTLTVTLTVNSGSFDAVSNSTGVTATRSGTGNNLVTLVGKASDINNWLQSESLKYITVSNASGNNVATVTIQATDGVATRVANASVPIHALNTPDVLSVTASPASGYFKAGSSIDIMVKFDGVVNSADAKLNLQVGSTSTREINLFAGSGTDTLVFRYIVQAGDTSFDLDYVASTSLTGNVTANGYAGNLALPNRAETGSLGANAAIVVDTTPPVITAGKITLSGATGGVEGNRIYKIGDAVTVSWGPTDGDGDIHLSSSPNLGTVTVDFSVFRGNNTHPATFNVSTGKWEATHTIAAGVLGENLNVSVTATDAAGNFTTRNGVNNATVDAIAPGGPVITGFADNVSNTGSTADTITANTRPTIMGTAEPSSTVEIFVGDNKAGEAVVDQSGNWVFTFPNQSPLAAGNNAITVKNRDFAGNVSPTSNVFNIIVDIDPPIVTITSSVAALKAGETALITFTFSEEVTGFDNGDINVAGGSLSNIQVDPSDSKKFTATFTPDANFEGPLSVTVQPGGYFDVANNPGVAGTSPAVTIDTLMPNVEVTGPSQVVTQPFKVTITFSEQMQGFTIEDITIAADTGTLSELVEITQGRVWEVLVTPVLGKTILIDVKAAVAQDLAGNPNIESNLYSVQAGSPASEFAKYADEIRQILVSEAERELRTTLSVNKRITQNARERMIQADQAQQDCLKDLEDLNGQRDPKRIEDCQKKHRSVAFDVNGTASMDTTRMQTQGQFFGLQANEQSQSRDIVVGDFSILREKAGSQTATLSARWVRERDVSERGMLSYFVGADLAASDIKSTTFKGDNERVGLSVGVSGLYRIGQGLYLDGFASYGQGRNDLAMANDVLALTSQYTTRTTALGGALTGVLDYPWMQLRPELSWSYGRNKIGEVRFTGRAYGLTDDNLRLDAGAVTVSELMFRPEVRVPVAVGAKNTGTLRFAPRLLCEKVKAIVVTDRCGSGGEVGLEILSVNELTKMNVDLIYDRVGNTTRRSFKLGVDHRF
jgi:hypothetical protein